MSIAVNSDGTPVRGSFVPWERTVSAFNKKKSKITIAVSDLQDAEVIDALKWCVLTGCYIFAPLADYSFFSDFEELRDVFILHGGNIKELTFVYKLPKLFMFYLEEASLPNLKPLIDVCNAGDSLPGKCFGFYKCKVDVIRNQLYSVRVVGLACQR